MSSFWRNFHHWLHWKLSFWQLSVQPALKISSKWRHFRFSDAQFLINWSAILNTALRYPKHTGFDCNISLYNNLWCKWQFVDEWRPQGHFQNVGHRKWWKAEIVIFHCAAPMHHIFTIFTFKCMVLRVMQLNKVVVTKRALFSIGLKIQDGCQSYCSRYIIKYFEGNCTNINITKQAVFHSWFGLCDKW